MDGAKSRLKEKLDQLLREAAEVSVEKDRANGTIVGAPLLSDKRRYYAIQLCLTLSRTSLVLGS